MTICLSMIVKNEAHCIARCLESVKPYIDSYVISDTGSTDNTIEIIKEVLKDIPGEVRQDDWIDFATNRNISLEEAKTKADYVLFIDADDTLIVNNKNCFNKLQFPSYSLNIKQEPIVYDRICLISSKVPSKYVGVLHEFLEIPTTIASFLLEGCYINYGGDGNRSKDPAKYLKDAEVFEKALLDDPNNSRYVFYCAQSYRDGGNFQKAAERYAQRSVMGGWNEEAAYASSELGKVLEKINAGDTGNILSAYTKAFNMAPIRVEPLVFISAYLRKLKMFEVAYFYAKIGSRILKPKGGLFLQHECYDWRIWDELSVAAFYIGKYKESYILSEELLKNKLLPSNERFRVESNRDLAKAKL